MLIAMDYGSLAVVTILCRLCFCAGTSFGRAKRGRQRTALGRSGLLQTRDGGTGRWRGRLELIERGFARVGDGARGGGGVEVEAVQRLGVPRIEVGLLEPELLGGLVLRSWIRKIDRIN